jgi:hypothetical protein
MAYVTGEQRVLTAALAALAKSTDPTRRKCFVSYHAGDAVEVAAFIDKFGTVFIPKVIGVQDSDPFVESDDTDYILDKIREKYLTDSTVTIVLVGKCTWARKFVDWEVYSSLRHDKNNRRNGLLAIELKSVKGHATLPGRVSDNVTRNSSGTDTGYARWNVYPNSEGSLRAWIEDAFSARTTRANLIKNARERKKYNSACE